MTQTIDCPPSTRASATLEQPDFSAIKKRQQAMWASGDFALIGTTLQIVGESLCEAVDVRAGRSVLDVACGNGNATLAAARRFARVTGLDYVPSLLARASERAAAERLDVRLVEGDAEYLPFEDGRFDAVLSTFGVMFAPDHRRAAREMARVCRPRGKIGLASWTRDGFIGKLLGVVGRYVPPVPGVASPILWGSEAHVSALFEDRFATLAAKRRDFMFRYENVDHFVDVFRRFYGPTHKAFAAIGTEEQAAMAADIALLVEQHNVSGSPEVVVPAEYLEVVIETKGR
jgi:ubiquinone/menaquinone biosynthesis C-methylase UbiE